MKNYRSALSCLIASVTIAAAPNAFSSLPINQTAGTTYANQTFALAEISNAFDTQLMTHLLTENALTIGRPTLWAAAQYGYDSLNSSGVSGLNTHTNEFAAGADLALNNTTIIGAALGTTHFNEEATDQQIANASGNLYQLGAYIQHAINQWRLSGELSYGFTDNIDANRTNHGIVISTPPANQPATASYNTDIWSAQAQVGYQIPLSSANYHVQPFAGVIGQQVSRGAFSEGGDTFSTLNVDASTYQSLRSQLGASADAALFSHLKLFGSACWEHEFADTHGEADGTITNHIGINSPLPTTFNDAGTDIGRDAAVIAAGVSVPVYKNIVNVNLAYQGRFAKNLQENAGALQAAYNF